MLPPAASGPSRPRCGPLRDYSCMVSAISPILETSVSTWYMASTVTEWLQDAERNLFRQSICSDGREPRKRPPRGFRPRPLLFYITNCSYWLFFAIGKGFSTNSLWRIVPLTYSLLERSRETRTEHPNVNSTDRISWFFYMITLKKGSIALKKAY